jgi:hypothetical protein
MHSSVSRMSSGSKRKSQSRLIVALRIAMGVKSKTSLLSRVHLALIFIREKLVRSTSCNSQSRLQCSLGIFSLKSAKVFNSCHIYGLFFYGSDPKCYVSGSVFWLLSQNTGTESEHSNQPEFRFVTEIPLSRSDLGMTSLLMCCSLINSYVQSVTSQ